MKDDMVSDSSSQIYVGKGDQNYNIEIYHDLGQAILISLLDMEEANPYSRVVTSQFQNMKTLRDFAAK